MIRLHRFVVAAPSSTRLALLALLWVGGCGSDSVETPASGAGSLSVINATSATVDVRVDGTVRFSSVAASTITAGVSLTPGTHTVQLASAGSTVTSASVSVEIGATGKRVVAATRSGAGVNAIALADTGSVVGVGRSKLRVLHLASSAPPLDIWRTQPDYQTPISVMFPYTYLSGATMESSAGTWEVRVWPTGGASWSSASSALVVPVASGQMRTVVTLDASGGGVKLQVLDP